MASYIICLTSGSGIPVFTRSTGNVKALPFPVIGSLNAVHMFAANQNACLKSTTTDSAKIVWQEFHDSVVLISVQSKDNSSSDILSERHLELVFNSMVLLYGLEDLTHIKNVERFKREIKISHQLVDSLLLQDSLPLFSDLHQAVDLILAPEAAMLQNFLQAFSEAAGSSYGCVFVHGRVVVATDQWWSLSPTALTLLQLLISSFSSCTSRDIPVYIPHLSPTVPHRLLTFELLPNVQVCVICGPTPSLSELEREAVRFWTPAIDSLKSVRYLYPRNFPSSIDMNSHVIGFILVNTELHKSISSVDINRDTDDVSKVEKRRWLLRSFYKQVMGTYFHDADDGQDQGASQFCHDATDTYIVSSGYKCYAHSTGPYRLFVLYSPKIPTFSMRSVTQKILHAFVKDKSMHI